MGGRRGAAVPLSGAMWLEAECEVWGRRGDDNLTQPHLSWYPREMPGLIYRRQKMQTTIHIFNEGCTMTVDDKTRAHVYVTYMCTPCIHGMRSRHSAIVSLISLSPTSMFELINALPYISINSLQGACTHAVK